MSSIDHSTFNTPPYFVQRLVESEALELLQVCDPSFNSIEAAMQQLLTDLWIPNAYGVQLDVLGRILNLSRTGRDDSNYRTLLSLKAATNRSSGNPEDLIKVIKTVYGASLVTYIPDYPAKVEMEHNGDGGLFILNQAEFLAGDLIFFLDGDPLDFQDADLTLEAIILNSVPAGVGLTVTKV